MSVESPAPRPLTLHIPHLLSAWLLLCTVGCQSFTGRDARPGVAGIFTRRSPPQAEMPSGKVTAFNAVRFGEDRLATGDAQGAVLWADKALRADSTLATAWALRGRGKRLAGQPDQALGDLYRAADLAPDDGSVLLEIAELYRAQGRPRRALTTLQHLAARDAPGIAPQHLFYLQGLALAALGRYDDAAARFLAASQHGPGTAEILYRLAEAEWHAGRAPAAQAAAERALAVDANHQPALALLEQLREARPL